jgi:hypothetical protein
MAGFAVSVNGRFSDVRRGKHDLFQGSCAVSQEDYDAIVPPLLARKHPEYGDPYIFAFIGVVALFSSMEFRWEHAMRGVPAEKIVLFDKEAHTGEAAQKVDFVFDTGKKLMDRKARSLYQDVLTGIPVYDGKLGSIDFRDDTEFVPLQAADLAAWQRRRRLCSIGEGMRAHYERLHNRPTRFRHTMLNKKELQETVDEILERFQRLGLR